MKFELTDGTILSSEEMAKLDDCGCVGMHDGIPHWIHMDNLVHSMNKPMLDRGNDEKLDYSQRLLSLLGFATEEKARLAELFYQMKKYKVARIIRE